MEESYFNVIPDELYNVIISNLDFGDFDEIARAYGMDRLNVSILKPLAFPAAKNYDQYGYINLLKSVYVDWEMAQKITFIEYDHYNIFNLVGHSNILFTEGTKDIDKKFLTIFYSYYNNHVYRGRYSKVLNWISETNKIDMNILSTYLYDDDAKLIFIGDGVRYYKYDDAADDIIGSYERLNDSFIDMNDLNDKYDIDSKTIINQKLRTGICFRSGLYGRYIHIREIIKRYIAIIGWDMEEISAVGGFSTIEDNQVLYLEHGLRY